MHDANDEQTFEEDDISLEAILEDLKRREAVDRATPKRDDDPHPGHTSDEETRAQHRPNVGSMRVGPKERQVLEEVQEMYRSEEEREGEGSVG